MKAEDRPHGLVPGEGAGFVLLLASKHVGFLPPVPRAWLGPSSIAVEPSPWYSGKPTRAIGLTTAITGAFPAPLAALRADVTYSDLNGEPWRSDERSFAYIRTAENHGEPMHLRHPADCWGDVGAASVPLLACMAAQEVEHPRMRTETALICGTADTRASRSAALVLRAEVKPEPWV